MHLMARALSNKRRRFLHDWKEPSMKYDLAQQNYLFAHLARSVPSSPGAVSASLTLHVIV